MYLNMEMLSIGFQIDNLFEIWLVRHLRS